jgi:hypothetical protein
VKKKKNKNKESLMSKYNLDDADRCNIWLGVLKLETSYAEGDKHMEDVCFTVFCLLNVRCTTYTVDGGMVSSRG